MQQTDNVPRIYSIEENEEEIWIARDKIEGDLVYDLINHDIAFDSWNVIKKTLKKVIVFEKKGYYCSDVRTWNLILDKNQDVFFIDYGSMTRSPCDCAWPWDLLLSFVIFMNEVLDRKSQLSDTRGMKMFTALKKHLSSEQIAQILLMDDEKNVFSHLYDILFNIHPAEKRMYFMHSIADKELLAVENLLELNHNALSTYNNNVNSYIRTTNQKISDLQNQLADIRELVTQLTDTVIRQEELLEKQGMAIKN